ncbi:unnamed protein product [Calicophoron daubneyi]|uniref:protein-serine/threonine phosphatase n=1 Tax=Calicophoron daubneyi TaxID=300641 RepID=A0AAV2T6N7_CALDB
MNRQMIPNRLRARLLKNIARLLLRLLDKQVLKGMPADMTEHEVIDMCLLLTDIVPNDTPVVDIRADTPIIIVGDTYAQYGHLVRIFNCYGHPPEMRYMLLGNYLSQKQNTLETIILLFAYKALYPKSIYLLRGKHECARMGKYCGFYDECLKRFSRRIWNAITSVFCLLPVIGIINDKVFCVHSGLSPMFKQFDVRGIEQLKNFVKKNITFPANYSSNRLLTHFVWSDPDESIDEWDQNPCGLGYLYGKNVVNDFCQRFNISQIVRSSEMVKAGFEFFPSPKLLTIFSAPDYMDTYANKASVMLLMKGLTGGLISQLKVISPIIRLRCKQTLRMNITLEEVFVHLGHGVFEEGEEIPECFPLPDKNEGNCEKGTSKGSYRV